MGNKIKGSKISNPISAENGSIITVGSGTIVETKTNGAKGWSFTVWPGGKDKEPQIATGVNGIIYLPLPYVLYALDPKGQVLWTLSPWNSSDRLTVKTPMKRMFMECAADEHFFYSVYGDEKGSYKLIAIDNKGNYYWDYWLGDVIDVHILPGGARESLCGSNSKTWRANWGEEVFQQ